MLFFHLKILRRLLIWEIYERHRKNKNRIHFLKKELFQFLDIISQLSYLLYK